MKNKYSNTELQALADNLTTHVPKTTFTVSGTAYSASKVSALAKGVLTARSAATALKVKWKAARDEAIQAEAAAAPVVSAVRLMLRPMLGNGSTALPALAVSPRKMTRALTSEEKVASAEKARATRLARGTQSQKQKAKVKGNVTGIVVTTVTTADAATPTTAPSTVPAASAPVASVAVPVVAAPMASVVPAAPASMAVAAGAPAVTGH